MFSLRTHVIICGALFAALFGIALIGNVLQRAGVPPPPGAWLSLAMACYFGLFVAFGLSAIPVIVKLVLLGQVKLGNGNIPIVAAAVRREHAIIWSLWGLMLAGLVVAVPAAIANGMFGDGPRHALEAGLRGRTRGVLAAKPNMSLDDLVSQSTLKVELKYASSSISGGTEGPFDFRIPGTTLTFPRSRYYYITTFRTDSTHIEAVNVGISPDKLTRAAIDAADVALRERLVNDGWLAGHEVYRDELDRRLHSGASEGPGGQTWLKDGTVLDIRRKRLDDEQAGEDTMTSGEWIQYIELWPATSYTNFDRYVFQAPRR